MTLEPTLVADCLVNMFGAGGAFVVANEVQRSDPRGPVSRRIAYALWFIAALFLIRAWSWLFNGSLADALADTMASATPLVSLIVAEGLLRRHAPRALKIALASAPAVVFCAKLLPFVPAIVPVVLLLVTVVGGFVAIASLLWQRDVDSLTVAENTSVRRVLIALLFLAPLIITDFRFIWPDIPVRLGAVGALLLLYLGLGVGSLNAPFAGRMLTLIVFAAIAGLFATGYVAAGHVEGGPDQMVRAAAVGLAGLMFAGLFSEAQGARFERTRATVPLVEAADPEVFLRRLSSHPLLGDGRLPSSAELEQVDHPDFRSLLARHRVLRRSNAPWGRTAIDNGVERALSLMMAHDATHLALITETPIRLLAVSLPATATDARVETEIDVARIVGELVYSRAAQP